MVASQCSSNITDIVLHGTYCLDDIQSPLKEIQIFVPAFQSWMSEYRIIGVTSDVWVLVIYDDDDDDCVGDDTSLSPSKMFEKFSTPDYHQCIVSWR